MIRGRIVTDGLTAPCATLILRIGLGVLFLAHAVQKLCVFKMARTATYFSRWVSPLPTSR
jgi:uncharacterized membrane protein YphA (DoxX/SURF4 family)